MWTKRHQRRTISNKLKKNRENFKIFRKYFRDGPKILSVQKRLPTSQIYRRRFFSVCTSTLMIYCIIWVKSFDRVLIHSRVWPERKDRSVQLKDRAHLMPEKGPFFFLNGPFLVCSISTLRRTLMENRVCGSIYGSSTLHFSRFWCRGTICRTPTHQNIPKTQIPQISFLRGSSGIRWAWSLKGIIIFHGLNHFASQ